MAAERKNPKEFVPASYSRSNTRAIEQVEKLLKHQGYAIIPKREDFGPDIKAEKDFIIEFYEVETKTGYTFCSQEDFRFPTGQCSQNESSLAVKSLKNTVCLQVKE